MFLLLSMAVRLFVRNKIIIFKVSVFRLRRDTLREKGYRKDQYMRCKVKNSVSFLFSKNQLLISFYSELCYMFGRFL
jgi:hypothetical protein